MGTTARSVSIGNVTCGAGQPLLWILGPCVIESHDLTLQIAELLEDGQSRLDRLARRAFLARAPPDGPEREQRAPPPIRVAHGRVLRDGRR